MPPETQPADATTIPYFVFELDGKIFSFKKPSVAQLDHMTNKARKSPVSAAKSFTLEIIDPNQKLQWQATLEEKPGAAAEAMQEIMEKLGFRN